jgi:steroid delta-isomerase-like uncharacterized protein
MKNRLNMSYSKKYLLLAFSCLFFAACKDSYPRISMEIVRERFEAFNKHDLKNLYLYYTDSATLETSSLEGRPKGREAVKEAYARYFTASPDLKYEITHIGCSGDTTVFVEFNSTGTILNREAGVPEYMQGKKYVLKNCSVFEMKDHKIKAERCYFDQVAFLRQMGFFEQEKGK